MIRVPEKVEEKLRQGAVSDGGVKLSRPLSHPLSVVLALDCDSVERAHDYQTFRRS